ncbi:hypothetical protein V6N13_093791 [Hibiscus sabdariffa]
MFIQETKLECFTLAEVRIFWGDNEVDFTFSPSLGRSGVLRPYGIVKGHFDVSLWREDSFMSTNVSPPSIAPCWNPPPTGMVKFLVDGVSRDKAAYGGAMHDDSRIISIMFSDSLSPLESKFVDFFLAIFKALELFREAKWIGRATLIVEADLRVILNWLQSPYKGRGCGEESFGELDKLGVQFSKVRVQLVSRK